jgi:hypothetical protein
VTTARRITCRLHANRRCAEPDWPVCCVQPLRMRVVPIQVTSQASLTPRLAAAHPHWASRRLALALVGLAWGPPEWAREAAKPPKRQGGCLLQTTQHPGISHALAMQDNDASTSTTNSMHAAPSLLLLCLQLSL